MTDRLLVEGSPCPASTVTVAGVEITSKEDWDRVLLKLEELMRENERLRGIIETCECGAAEALEDYHNKDSETS